MPEEKTTDAEPLSLTGLEVENVLRIKAVKLTLEPGGALIIEGRNEQGKSSVLKSLEMLLAGMSETPDEPLHGDAKEGQIVATFGDIVVTKTFKHGRSPALSIHRDGKRQTAPQTLLNELLDRVSLDPLKFMQADDHERLRVLSDVMGFDSAPFDLKHGQVYDKRRDANRDVKRLQIEGDAAPHHADAPDEEVSVIELGAELERRQHHNRMVADKGARVVSRSAAVEASEQDIDRAHNTRNMVNKEITELENELIVKRKTLAGAISAIEDRRGELSEAQEALADAKADQDAVKPADDQEVITQIAGAEDANRKYRDNVRSGELHGKLLDAEESATTFDEMLATIEAERDAARLAARENLPVPELDITRDAVLYRGKPLSQAGSSAQLRVSVAVALAVNKDARVKLLLIDDAEKLDSQNTEVVLSMAREAGFQVLMARVGDGGKASVLIEDGTVKEG